MFRRSVGRLWPVMLFAALPTLGIHAQVARPAARSTHVILVITDGFRWQELFGGADSSLMRGAGRVADTAALRRDFWRESHTARRATLLPFIWGTMAQQGQVFGDSSVGSIATLTNGLKFSYPGYSEAFTGHVDPRIDSNEHPPNENRTVFEWLNAQPALSGRVAAFATWSAFRRIINTERSGVPVYDGWDHGVAPTGTLAASTLQAIYASRTKMWADVADDALMHATMKDYQRVKRPRVLFVGYGETDEWAHSGRYDMYLRAAHQVDAFLSELWRDAQANPATRGRTTLIVTTDHGRGTGGQWTDHGQKVNGAERIWIAAMGPEIAARGVRRDAPTTQSQIAATIARALGYDWTAAEPRAARALPFQ